MDFFVSDNAVINYSRFRKEKKRRTTERKPTKEMIDLNKKDEINRNRMVDEKQKK
jgi:hypothetical protein